jgi:hypothetical protein
MNEPSVWDLVKEDRFEEACASADREYEETGSYPVLRNKMIALMMLGKFDEAISISRMIIKSTNGRIDFDFIFLGAIYWIKREYAVAVSIWKEGLNAGYTDAAGGVEIPMLLFFAAVHTQDPVLKKEADKMLKKKIKSKTSVNWPAALGNYLVGAISEDVLHQSFSENPILKSKQKCKADFYAALMRLMNGEKLGYVEKLKSSLSHGPVTYLLQEYHLARAELELTSQP